MVAALQITVTDALTAGAPDVRVINSYQVCEAWVHILDSVIWPVDNTSADALPDISGNEGTTQLW